MKKLISPKMIFLYILIILSTVIIFNKNNNNNITYLNIGDGYAKGLDSFGINRYGYGDYLRDKLQDHSELKEYINIFTDNNMNIENIENYITNSNYCVSKKQKKSFKGYLQEADLITLSIGLNDLKYEILSEELDSTKMNESLVKVATKFNNLIKEIKKYYKNTIYVIGYPINNLDSYYLSMSIRQYNDFLENNPNIVYISPKSLDSKYFLNPKSNYYNIDGHKLISESIYKTYEKSLKNK